MQAGACSLEVAVMLSEVLNNFERVSDHCSNLAESLIAIHCSGSIDAHAYLKTLREGEYGKRFQAQYEEYLKLYAPEGWGE